MTNSLLLVNEGEVAMLQALFALGVTLRLYQNDRNPVKGDTVAAYDECDFPGYVAKVLIAESWTFAPGLITTAMYPQQTFELTDDISEAPQYIRGYYLVQVGTNKLLWVQKFKNSTGADTPILVMIAGQGCLLTPKISLTQEV